MDHTTTEARVEVPPEEVERRIAEFRRISFERGLPALVVYHGANASCPWPGCGLRIQGIRFQLETMGSPSQVSSWFASWWNGPGLVGRCPRCQKHVRFEVTRKSTVTDLTGLEGAILPEDWDTKAYVVIRPE
jgi:hypothetical protein